MRKLSIAALGSLGLQACTSVPLPAYLAAPADPTAPVRPVSYQSVTAGTRTFRPVDPKGWEDLNRDVAPKPGEGMSGMDHGDMKGMGNMPGMDHGGMKGMDGR